MRTEELIHELAQSAQPVRPLRPVGIRLLGWIVLVAGSFGVVVSVMGTRADLAAVATSPTFAFEAALLIVTALSAAVGALVVSVPGAERTVLVRWAPVMAGIAAVLWVIGDLAASVTAGAPELRFTFGWSCVWKTASVGAVPGTALFAMVRQAAPLRAGWAGLLAVLATAAVGVLGANVICPSDRPLHLLLWHVGPLMVCAALGAALGVWLLRWTPRRR
ncbi:MAG: NrsF family protein [Acidobacteriota bacterium]